MFIYPENLKQRAQLWMWELKDIAIIGTGLIISLLFITKLHMPLPLVVTCAYAFLSIRLDNMCIRDYIAWAWNFLVSQQQYFEWRAND